MALWPTRANRAVEAARPVTAAATPSARIYELLPPGYDSTQWVAPVSRVEALSLPAVARAVDLVATTVAGLPLQRFTTDGTEVPLGWLEQPEPGRPRFATFTDIGLDLIFDGVSYLVKNPERVGGYTYVPTTSVNVTSEPVREEPWRTREIVTVNGVTIDPGRLLAVEGWHDGIRNHGARTIRTALAFEQASRRSAESPIPAVALQNTGNYELSDDEIDALLAAWKQARATSSTAYLNAGVQLATYGFSSRDQQAVEARQLMNGQIANLCGVPAHMIAGAQTPGSSSLTYANVTQENRSFIDFGLNPLINALENRLSMELGGDTVRFNLAGMLRGNPTEVAELIATLLPLDVITVAEARQWADLAPTDTGPSLSGGTA